MPFTPLIFTTAGAIAGNWNNVDDNIVNTFLQPPENVIGYGTGNNAMPDAAQDPRQPPQEDMLERATEEMIERQRLFNLQVQTIDPENEDPDQIVDRLAERIDNALINDPAPRVGRYGTAGWPSVPVGLRRKDVGPKIKSDNIGEILGKEKLRFLNLNSDEWVLGDQKATIGIEVELENVDPRAVPNSMMPDMKIYWEWHTDESLHDNGMEFTLREPLFGEDIKVALKGLLSRAAQYRWKPSLRTGIHIHMDARDMSRYQLLGLIAYYVVFEPALYAWIGHNRHANNFCVPWYKYEGALEQASEILDYMRKFQDNDNITENEVNHVCDKFNRYAGLNLKSLAVFGSLEFRQLETTLNYEEVRDWINILMSLKKAALEVPESTLTIIHEINRRGIAASLERIFGSNISEIMLKNNPAILEDIEQIGIPNAIELISYVTTPNREGVRIWDPSTAKKIKKDHQGFTNWRKANFPKDQEPNQKEVKNKEKVENPRRDPWDEEEEVAFDIYTVHGILGATISIPRTYVLAWLSPAVTLFHVDHPVPIEQQALLGGIWKWWRCFNNHSEVVWGKIDEIAPGQWALYCGVPGRIVF